MLGTNIPNFDHNECPVHTCFCMLRLVISYCYTGGDCISPERQDAPSLVDPKTLPRLGFNGFIFDLVGFDVDLPF